MFLDPDERLAPPGQRHFGWRAAARWHHRAERAHMIKTWTRVFNIPSCSRPLQRPDDFFQAQDDIEPDPVRGLAMRRTNFIRIS